MTKTPAEKARDILNDVLKSGASVLPMYPITRGIVATLHGLRVMPSIPQAKTAAKARAPVPWNTEYRDE